MRARDDIGLLIPRDLQRHATWSVLLELYANEREGGVVLVKHIMRASGETPASAIRLIDRLEEARFVHRVPDIFDRRCIVVQLTDLGRSTVVTMLERLFDTAEELAGA